MHLPIGIVAGLVVQAEIADLADALRRDRGGLGHRVFDEENTCRLDVVI